MRKRALIAAAALAIAGSLLIINRGFMRADHTDYVIRSSHRLMASDFSLTSPAFEDGGSIPKAYACDGDGISPPLRFSGAPEGTVSFALVAIDPDVPKEVKDDGRFVHLILFNIPATTSEIAQGETIGLSGENGRGEEGYAPPCPPLQYEPQEHRYVFTLYALDDMLSLESGATEDEVMQAMEGHVLDQAVLTGRYKQNK